MKFVFPCAAYEQKAVEFIEEFHTYSSAINGTGGLDRFLRENTYAAWLEHILAEIDFANIPAGRVPSITYFYVRENDGRIIGMINIRLAVNDFLRKQGGQIGYAIRPSERGNGYGSKMLAAALDFMKPLGFRSVLISCDKENAASAGVIKNCGGILEEEFYSDFFQETIQRYRIDL